MFLRLCGMSLILIFMTHLHGCKPKLMSVSAVQVAGGEVSKVGSPEFRKTVAVGYAFILDGQIHFQVGCSASILASDAFLTAAHCGLKGEKNIPQNHLNVVNQIDLMNRENGSAPFYPTHILFGDDFSSLKDLVLSGKDASIDGTLKTKNITFVRVKKWIPHPEFPRTQTELGNDSADVAVLRTYDSYPQGWSSVTLISSFLKIPDAAPVVIAGFGYETDVISGHLRVLRTITQSFSLPDGRTNFDLGIFRAVTQDGFTPCSGDSGGPVFVQLNQQWYQAAVTVEGASDCQKSGSVTKGGTSDTFLTKYVDWIRAEQSK